MTARDVPGQATTGVRWQGYSHAELYAQVHSGPGGGASTSAEAVWRTIAATITTIDRDLAAEVTRIGAGWEGPAAGRVTEALTPLGSWLTDTIRSTQATHDAIAAQATQAAQLRNTMPEPPYPDLPERPLTLGTRNAAGGWNSWADADAAAATAAAHAAELMASYSDATEGNQRSMATWATPPAVTVDGSGPATSGVAPAGVPAPAGPAGPGALSPAGVAVSPGVAPPPAAPAAPPVPGVAGTTIAAAPGAVAPTGPGSRPASGPAPGRAPDLAPAAATGPGGPWSSTGPAAAGRPAGTAAAPAWSPPRRAGSTPIGGGPPPFPALTPFLSTGGAQRPGLTGSVAPRDTAEPTARTGRAPAEAAPGAGPARPTGTRGAPQAGGTGMYPPMGGGAGGQGRQTHPRPSYLLEDADIFADDRWFTPPVIGADDSGDHCG